MINKLLCDSELIELLRQKNAIVWEFVYSKYATMMYGHILQYTGNKTLADEILAKTFDKLKSNFNLDTTKNTIGLNLLNHACETAKEFLNKKSSFKDTPNFTTEFFSATNNQLGFNKPILIINEGFEVERLKNIIFMN